MGAGGFRISVSPAPTAPLAPSLRPRDPLPMRAHASFLRIRAAPSGRPVPFLVARYPLTEPGALEEIVERFERERGVPRWQEAADVLQVE